MYDCDLIVDLQIQNLFLFPLFNLLHIPVHIPDTPFKNPKERISKKILGCPMNTVKSQAVDCLLHPRVFRLFIQGKIDA